MRSHIQWALLRGYLRGRFKSEQGSSGFISRSDAGRRKLRPAPFKFAHFKALLRVMRPFCIAEPNVSNGSWLLRIFGLAPIYSCVARPLPAVRFYGLLYFPYVLHVSMPLLSLLSDLFCGVERRGRNTNLQLILQKSPTLSG